MDVQSVPRCRKPLFKEDCDVLAHGSEVFAHPCFVFIFWERVEPVNESVADDVRAHDGEGFAPRTQQGLEADSWVVAGAPNEARFLLVTNHDGREVCLAGFLKPRY